MPGYKTTSRPERAIVDVTSPAITAAPITTTEIPRVTAHARRNSLDSADARDGASVASTWRNAATVVPSPRSAHSRAPQLGHGPRSLRSTASVRIGSRARHESASGIARYPHAVQSVVLLTRTTSLAWTDADPTCAVLARDDNGGRFPYRAGRTALGVAEGSRARPT